MKLGINFTVVGAVMLFVIHITLNKIYITLKEIKSLLKMKKN